MRCDLQIESYCDDDHVDAAKTRRRSRLHKMPYNMRGVLAETMLWRGFGPLGNPVPCGHSRFCSTYANAVKRLSMSFVNNHGVVSIRIIHNYVIRNFLKYLSLPLLISCCSNVEDRMHLFEYRLMRISDFAKKTFQ